MRRNKKIDILITILVIIIIGITVAFIYKNRKVDNIAIWESNKNQMQENNIQENIIQNENIIENVVENHAEKSNTIANDAISQSQVVEENKTTENIQKNQEKNTNTSTKKENNKTTTTNKQQTTNDKSSSQIPKKEPDEKKSEETTTVNNDNDNTYKEKEVQIAPVTECVGNNHKIGAGNSGKWFNTQAEAGEYFKAEIKKWGDKWESFEIENDEYYKNCPYGYEVWTCPQCQKWTINFYYNK